MEIISSFIPMDRRQALVRGSTLPDRTVGTALCTDISGFTALTEAFATSLGPQRGAEELTGILNNLYESLIAEVDRYGGSVISFSGDAITCWFDTSPMLYGFHRQSTTDDELQAAVLRATTCALAMQAVMQQFAALPLPGGGTATLAMKIAVACGPARRFLVGNPQQYCIEVLAGATLDRLATAEQLARKGEVILDLQAAAQLGALAQVIEWRAPGRDEARCAVLHGLVALAAPLPWPGMDRTIEPAQARPWILPAVYERLHNGDGEFLTELRPAVPLFLQFSGLDYDGDDTAGERLDAYLRWVQQVLARYEGVLIQVTMGDKGGYLYAAFGVPHAHPDDAVRAVGAALELRAPPPHLAYIAGSQIGISAGRVRAGTYGGTTRTYGALGDVVNLAARLMQAAGPGQVLLTDSVAAALDRRYMLQTLAPIRVKGKADLVSIAAVVGARTAPTIRLQEPQYTLPIVGRESVLAEIEAKLAQALGGQGQILGIIAEAGMGKSRLVAEIIQRATVAGMAGYGGEAQPYGTSTAYLAWRPIWRAFFGLDLEVPLTDQLDLLERELAAIDPTLAPRLPLLGVVLDLPLADNDLTRSLDARRRKEAIEGFLVDCLRARAATTPLLLVLEDAHWLDPLSFDLLAALGRALATLPALLVLAYRPREAERNSPLPMGSLPHMTEIRLDELSSAEVEQLIALKLEALFGPQTTSPTVLVERITARAAGNPFYIEELLNYVKGRGIALFDTAALEQLDLPASLTSLILSRIDQLTPEQRTLLKVASIIGRVFPVAWLWGVHPSLGPAEHVRSDLDLLAQLDLTPLDQPEPDRRYLFKHIMMQEVTYESLPFALRTQLHEQLARWLEERADGAPPLDLLAFHYGRSANRTKQREYYRRAGDAATVRFANAAAIIYYEQLLDLLDVEEQGEVLLALGEVLERTGTWDAATARYRAALTLAQMLNIRRLQAQAWAALGSLEWGRGAHEQATTSLEQARAGFTALGEIGGLVRTLNEMGAMYRVRGDFDRARAVLEESLIYARDQQDEPGMARALHILGNLASTAGDCEAARAWFAESLAIRRRLGDRLGVAGSLNNLGLTYFDLGDYTTAQALVDEGIAIFHELGARRESAIALLAQGRLALVREETVAAWRHFAQSLAVFQDLGVKWESVNALVGIANAIGRADQTPAGLRWAVRLAGAAVHLLESFGGTLLARDRSMMDQTLEYTRAILGLQATAAAWSEGQSLPWSDIVAHALNPASVGGQTLLEQAAGHGTVRDQESPVSVSSSDWDASGGA